MQEKGPTVPVTDARIQEAADLLRAAAHPRRIVLFGSHARGDARPDSDADFLVVLAGTPDRRSEMVRLRHVLRPLRIPVDVVVVSERDVDDWADVPGTLIWAALREGRVLHDAV